jgi:hypothetical protein
VQQETEDQNYSMYVGQHLGMCVPCLHADPSEWEGWFCTLLSMVPGIHRHGSGTKIWSIPVRQWRAYQMASKAVSLSIICLDW